MTNAIEVSVVMPCLNEEKTLAGCIEAAFAGIAASGIPGEVIVSDNGSSDRSVQIAEAAGARVVHCEQRGYGSALRAGFEAARGRWILMGDADQSYDFKELPRFKIKIDEGFELVMGSRLKGRIEPGAMPWHHRWIGNPILSGILRLLFRSRVSDAHCGLRAFTKQAVEKMDLRTAGMELASEMVIKAARRGIRTAELPITLYRDARDRSPHLRSFRDGWRHLRYMLMMAPNWLYFLPGFLLIGGGGLLMLLLVTGPVRLGRITLDVHTMLLGMALVILGVYLVQLGAFVKAFTYSERLDVKAGSITRALNTVELEHGLLFALILIVAGFIGDAVFLASWISEGMGPLDIQTSIRPAIIFTTILIVGIELFFGSFFLSMLGVSRDDYIGAYTTKKNQGGASPTTQNRQKTG